MYCLKAVIYPFTVPKFISLILQNSAKRYHHRSRAIIHGLLKNTCTTRANNKRSMYFYSSVRRYIYLRNKIQNLIKDAANQFEGFVFPSAMITINHLPIVLKRRSDVDLIINDHRGGKRVKQLQSKFRYPNA